MSINLLADDPYKHVLASCRRAKALYIFPISERAIFLFFLKSTNAKYCRISPNTHSTETLTLLIALLHACCSAVKLLFLKGACK